MTLQNPASVVLFLEFDQCLAKLLHGLEGPHPEQVLLEDPDEPFGAIVPLGLADERRGTPHSQECELPLERIREIRRPMVVSESQSLCYSWSEAPEPLLHSLTDWLERLEAIARLRGVPLS